MGSNLRIDLAVREGVNGMRADRAVERGGAVVAWAQDRIPADVVQVELGDGVAQAAQFTRGSAG